MTRSDLSSALAFVVGFVGTIVLLLVVRAVLEPLPSDVAGHTAMTAGHSTYSHRVCLDTNAAGLVVNTGRLCPVDQDTGWVLRTDTVTAVRYFCIRILNGEIVSGAEVTGPLACPPRAKGAR